MFEHLAEHRAILVTGPQRSGTRICAKMIAHDTGHAYIDELNLNIDSLYRLQDAFSLTNVVIQCPAMCRFIHNFAGEEVLVVMMVRDIAGIIASQKRIDWDAETIEMVRYQVFDRPIAQTKYEFWETQKTGIQNYLEMEYESLASHPLWVPKEERINFTSSQTNA